MTKLPEQIINAVRSAGVVGAGGAGFPTYVKLQAQVDLVIVNGAECEPLLNSDCAMILQHPDWLVEGLRLAMQATGAKRGVIALKEYYTDQIDALKKVLPADGAIKLHLLENYYPAGDEFFIVYDVTGKIIPEGGIPLNVGAVVNNVATLMQVYQAANGKPVTERTVTLVGEFNEPKIVTVPIGTTYANLIKIAGGLTRDDVVLLDGGPMMGKIVDDWQEGIAKTTSGVLALPSDHFVVTMRQQTLSQAIKRSKSACCQCFRCSDLCPRNLLGHEIYPHLTMRSIDYNQAEPAKNITSAFLCSQCGVCELIACDSMQLSPRKIYAAYRKELVARGVKNPHIRTNVVANSEIDGRKIATITLLKKTDLAKYDIDINYEGVKTVKKVKISLHKHVGVPAIPNVVLGQKVRMCDIIAASPDDKLGSVYHASIEGKVTDISETLVEITA